MAARIDVITPTWDRPLLKRPTIRADRLVTTWRRVRPHVVVAVVSLLAGVLLWLPGGFELGLGARLGVGLFTGLGIATIATAISLSVPRE